MTESQRNTNEESDFQTWLRTVNNGNKTTLEQQFQLAFELYDRAYPMELENDPKAMTVKQVIELVESTPIDTVHSLVSWTGMQLGWFLRVFCQSPFMRVLTEFGCQVWFIRKICVIEILRRATTTTAVAPPPATTRQGERLTVTGTFVDNVSKVVQGWDLESTTTTTNGTTTIASTITAKPTVFISYTGAYTMELVIAALEKLDPNEYVWIDIFCVNQFAWTGKGRSPEMRKFRDIFMDDLQHQIASIAKTALILERWDNAMFTLGQMWVLWEIHNTAQAEVDLKVLLSPEQTNIFVRDCLEGEDFENIQKSLATINANDAKTEDDIDRELILKRMKEQDRTLTNVNTSVLAVMRELLAKEGIEYLSKMRCHDKQVSFVLLNNLGSLLQDQGKYNEAEPLLQEALAERRKVLGNRHPGTLNSIGNLGLLLRDQGKLDEAEPLLQETLSTSREVFGNRDPATLRSINNLGLLLKDQGKLDEAERLYKEALPVIREVLGNRNTFTLTFINNLGQSLMGKGKLDEAEPLFRESLSASRESFGNRHPATVACINSLGLLLQKQGKLDEAEPLFREALSANREVLGNRHPHTLTAIHNLGLLLRKQGNFDEAELLYGEALSAKREVLGNSHPSTVASIASSGSLLEQQGKCDEAEPLYREALAGDRQVLGNRHPHTLTSIHNLGSLLQKQGNFDEAEPLYQEALSARREVLGNIHPSTMASMNNLATLFQKQGKLDQAEPLLREALAASRKVLGNQHPTTLRFIYNLGDLLSQQDNVDQAELLYREAEEAELLKQNER